MRRTMPFFENKNDSALFCHKQQDDLADCSDGDSDVIAIGNTTTILAGKYSEDSDYRRREAESTEPVNRRLHLKFSTTESTIAKATNHSPTYYNKQKRKMPYVQNKKSFLAAAKKKNEAKSNSYYDKVFEGCNAFEPIEIYNDSEDDDDDYNLNDGIGYCGISFKNKNSAFKNKNRKIAAKSTTTITESTLAPEKITRKRGRSMLEKKELKQNGSHRNEMKEIDADLIENNDVKHHTISTIASAVTSGGNKHSFSRAKSLASNSTTRSVIDVDNSYRNILTETDIMIENKEIAVGIDDSTTVTQPQIEVINLTDDDNHTKPPQIFLLPLNGRIHRNRQQLEQCKNENFGHSSKEVNQVEGTARVNPDAQDGERANHIHYSLLSEENPTFRPIEEVKQNKALSILNSPENISSLKIDKGIKIIQDGKKRDKLKPLENTPGGMTLKQIFETKAEDDSRELMESEFIILPTSAFIGNNCSLTPVKGTEGKSDTLIESIYPKHQVEIIDVDEIEYIEVEVQNDKGFNYVGDLNTKTKGTTTKISKKPRFKPNKNKKVGKSEEKLSNDEKKRSRSCAKNRKRLLDHNNLAFRSSCPRFLSCLNNEEHLPKKRISNYASYNRFAQNDGDKIKRARSTSLSETCSSSCSLESRYIFHPSNRDSEYHHRNNFLGMNIEDARKQQDRLLQKAAARVRNQPSVQITSELHRSRNTSCSFTFSTLMRNVHIQHPDHWMYRNLYSRLGLPRHANKLMVKSQYRRLARVYHPDHNIGKPDTRHKFQAVNEAYNYLTTT